MRELEALRNEDWHKDFISICLQKFENLGWDTLTSIERINNAVLSKEWGTVTKFEHFINEDDLIIDYELVELKAKQLIESGGYYDGRTYEKLIEYYDTNIKNPKTDESADKIMYEVRLKVYMGELILRLYQDFINEYYETADFDKSGGNFISALRQEIENFKL